MDFIDRTEELARLVRIAKEAKGGFVVLWGRRRVGKSELLKEWCRRVGGLYTVADRSSAVIQRQNFASVVATVFAGFDNVVYPTWKALFNALSRESRRLRWHGPLVLDEIPYWVEADATVVSAMQNWVDDEKRAHGLLIAVAGSSQHMMQGLVLDADSPIYGRADEKMKLQPIAFPFIRDALGLKSDYEAVRAYAVWGGVPRYWVAAERYGSDLDEALDDQVLNPLGVFHDEPMTILQSEMPSAVSLKPYLDVVGLGANRMSEIASRLGIPATTVAKPLAKLVELGLVKRAIPYGEDEKNGKRSLYRIDDPLCRLWFKVVAPRRSVFDNAPASVRKSVWRSQSSGLFADAWEELARRSVADSSRLASLSGKGDYWLPAGRWWHGNEPELDVVSFNGALTKTLVGEVKWSEKPFSCVEVRRLARELLQRPVPAHFPSDVARVLFLSRVSANVPSSVDGVEIIDAASL